MNQDSTCRNRSPNTVSVRPLSSNAPSVTAMKPNFPTAPMGSENTSNEMAERDLLQVKVNHCKSKR